MSGHNPRVFELPFLRKVTSANAPSELYRYAAVPKSNHPVSPEVKPPSPPKTALTELGWTDPVATYSKARQRGIGFPLDAIPQLGCIWPKPHPLASGLMSNDKSVGLFPLHRATCVLFDPHQIGGNIGTAESRCPFH